MVSVKEANGEKIYETGSVSRYAPLFRENEVERAEIIANALRGLTIVSAQELLKKMEKYILFAELT